MSILSSVEIDTEPGIASVQGLRDQVTGLVEDLKNAQNALDSITPSGSAARNEFDNLNTSGKQVRGTLEDVKAGTEDSNLSLYNLTGTIGNLTSSIVTLAGAGALGALLIQVGEVAARTEVLNTVLNVTAQNVGQTDLQMEEQVQRVKELGITTQEATSSVLQFAQAQLNVADAAKLARAAQDLAVVAGKNSSDTFALLTQAIQAQHPIILRQFGIIQGLKQIYDDYGATIGKSGAALDELEKKQAFLNTILEQAAKVSGSYEASMNDVGKQMGSFKRYVEEAETALGQALLPIMLQVVLTARDMLEAFTNANPVIQTLITSVLAAIGFLTLLSTVTKGLNLILGASGLAATFGELATGIQLFIGAFSSGAIASELAALASMIPIWGAIAVAIGIAVAAYVGWTSATKINNQATFEEAAALKGQITNITELADRVDKLGAQQVLVGKDLDEYTSKLKQLREINPALVGDYDILTGRMISNRQAIEQNTTAILTQIDAKKKDLEADLALVKSQAAVLQSQKDTLNAIRDQISLGLQAKGATPDQAVNANPLTSPAIALAGNQWQELGRQVSDVNAKLSPLNAQAKTITDQINSLNESLGRFNAPAQAAANMATDLGTKLLQMYGKVHDLSTSADWTTANQNLSNLIAKAGPAAEKAFQTFKDSGTKSADDVQKAYTNLTDILDKTRAASEKTTAAFNKAVEGDMQKLMFADPKTIEGITALDNILKKISPDTDTYSSVLKRASEYLKSFNDMSDEEKAKLPGGTAEVQRLTQAFQAFQDLTAKAAAQKDMQKLLGVDPATIAGIQALDAALQKVAPDSQEYVQVLQRGSADIAKFNQLSDAQKAALPVAEMQRLTKAASDLQQIKLDVEMQKWLTAAQNAQKALTDLADKGIAKMNEELAASKTSFDAKWVAESQKVTDDIAKQDEALAQKQIGLSQSVVDQKIAANNKYYNDLIIKNNEQIAAINKLVTEEQDAGNKIIQTRRDELKAAVDSYTQKYNFFEAEQTAEMKLEDARLIKDADARATEIENIKKELTDKLALYQANIEAELTAAQTELTDETAARRKQAQTQIDDLTAQNAKIQQINHTTNLAIQKEYSDSYQILKGLADGFVSSVVNGLDEMLFHTKSFSAALTDIWKGIESSVTSVFSNIAKQYINQMIAPMMGSLNQLKGAMAGGPGGAPGMGPAVPGDIGASFTNPAGGFQMPQFGPVGGGIEGGVVGGNVGYDVTTQTGDKATGAAAGAASGALTGLAVGGPWGALIGGVIGLIGGLMGPSMQQQVDAARQKFIDAAGGLDKLTVAAQNAHTSLDELINAGSLSQLQDAINHLNNAFDLANLNELRTKTLTAAGGFDAFAKAATAAGVPLAMIEDLMTTSSLDHFNAVLQTINDALDAQKQRLAAVSLEQQGMTARVQGLTDMLKNMSDASGNIAASALPALQGEFNRVGDSASLVFENTLRETGDLTQAINAVSPALDQLIAAQQKYGFTASASLTYLLQFRRTITDNNDVAESLNGINLELQGMIQYGVKNQEQFDELGDSAGQMWQTLKDRGVAADQALMLMQPTLQSLWEAQQKFGYTTDTATQSLIDMGVQNGLVGENMKSVNDQILDVLKQIALALGATIPSAAQDASGAFNGMQTQIQNAKQTLDTFSADAQTALSEVGGAADGVSLGHSPGGLKEIPIKLQDAKAAMSDFQRSAVQDAKAVQTAWDAVIFPGQNGSSGVTPPTAPISIVVNNTNPPVVLNNSTLVTDETQAQKAWSLLQDAFKNAVDTNNDQLARDIERYISKYRKKAA